MKKNMDNVHRLLQKAVGDGNTVRFIAEQIDMPEHTLHAFKRRGSMRSKEVEVCVQKTLIGYRNGWKKTGMMIPFLNR